MNKTDKLRREKRQVYSLSFLTFKQSLNWKLTEIFTYTYIFTVIAASC